MGDLNLNLTVLSPWGAKHGPRDQAPSHQAAKLTETI